MRSGLVLGPKGPDSICTVVSITVADLIGSADLANKRFIPLGASNALFYFVVDVVFQSTIN